MNVKLIEDGLVELKGLEDEVERMHRECLSTADPIQSQGEFVFFLEINSLVEEKTQKFNQRAGELKVLLGRIKAERSSSLRDAHFKRLSKKLLQTMQHFDARQREQRLRYRNRIARQLRIIKPEATEAQVDELIAGDGDVFQQFNQRVR